MTSLRFVITDTIERQIVEHARACKPHEMCGLLVGEPGGDRALEFHPCRNAAASAIVYTLDPKDYMRVERDADDRGLAVLDRKSTRLNSSHVSESRMPSSA